MSFQLSPLPYATSALEPHISENTLNFHYGKHHQAYVNKLNDLTKGTSLEGQSLQGVIKESAGTPELVRIFNNAAQVWNHTFYWKSIKPKGGGVPSGTLFDMIEESFGSYEQFKTEFREAATSQFGSGWVWLVDDYEQLKIIKTSNADTPLCRNVTPLITCDVWEHAYYLDFQNRRPDYVNMFLSHLVNWDFAEHNLGK